MPGESRYAARHVDALWLPPRGAPLGLQPHGQRAAGNQPRRGTAFLETARSGARRRLWPAARFLALRPARGVGGRGDGRSILSGFACDGELSPSRRRDLVATIAAGASARGVVMRKSISPCSRSAAARRARRRPDASEHSLEPPSRFLARDARDEPRPGRRAGLARFNRNRGNAVHPPGDFQSLAQRGRDESFRLRRARASGSHPSPPRRELVRRGTLRPLRANQVGRQMAWTRSARESALIRFQVSGVRRRLSGVRLNYLILAPKPDTWNLTPDT